MGRLVGLDTKSDILHPVYMAKVATHPGHYFRAWRLRNGLTLRQAAERIERLSEQRVSDAPLSRPISMSHATLSRIERGRIPYNQVLLEHLAEIYRTDRASLIMRDPSDPEQLWSIWEQLKPMERTRAVEAIKALSRTGTDD